MITMKCSTRPRDNGCTKPTGAQQSQQPSSPALRDWPPSKTLYPQACPGLRHMGHALTTGVRRTIVGKVITPAAAGWRQVSQACQQQPTAGSTWRCRPAGSCWWPVLGVAASPIGGMGSPAKGVGRAYGVGGRPQPQICNLSKSSLSSPSSNARPACARAPPD